MARTGSTRAEPAVITAAKHPRSLDVEARTRRYLISMAVRTVAFVAMVFVPGLIAKLACLGAAMFIPPVAVLLANAKDNHSEPPVDDTDEPPHAALTAGHVIRGDVVEEDDTDQR